MFANSAIVVFGALPVNSTNGQPCKIVRSRYGAILKELNTVHLYYIRAVSRENLSSGNLTRLYINQA